MGLIVVPSEDSACSKKLGQTSCIRDMYNILHMMLEWHVFKVTKERINFLPHVSVINSNVPLSLYSIRIAILE